MLLPSGLSSDPGLEHSTEVLGKRKSVDRSFGLAAALAERGGVAGAARETQEPVEPTELRYLRRALQDAKLMTKGEDLKLQCRPGSKNRPREGER
jgi:hypothetical protein